MQFDIWLKLNQKETTTKSTYINNFTFLEQFIFKELFIHSYISEGIITSSETKNLEADQTNVANLMNVSNCWKTITYTG